MTSFVADPQRFHLLTVYQARLHRKAQADLRQLRELQASRRAEQPKAEPEKKHTEQPPAPRPEPAKPVAMATQTPDSESLNGPNGFVCSGPPMSEKEIEKYIMADPRQYASQPSEPPNFAATLL